MAGARLVPQTTDNIFPAVVVQARLATFVFGLSELRRNNNMRFAKLIAGATALLLAIFGWGLGAALPASASKNTIHVEYGAVAAHAPAKKVKGGLLGAGIWCGDDSSVDAPPEYYRVQVKKGSKTIATKTGKAAMRKWIRVKPGKYIVTTTAKCGNATKSFTKKLKVRTLKDSETVSRGEYKRIKKGMSKKKIGKIIGGKIHVDLLGDCIMPTTVWARSVELIFDHGKLWGKGWGTPE